MHHPTPHAHRDDAAAVPTHDRLLAAVSRALAAGGDADRRFRDAVLKPIVEGLDGEAALSVGLWQAAGLASADAADLVAAPVRTAIREGRGPEAAPAVVAAVIDRMNALVARRSIRAAEAHPDRALRAGLAPVRSPQPGAVRTVAALRGVIFLATAATTCVGAAAAAGEVLQALSWELGPWLQFVVRWGLGVAAGFVVSTVVSYAKARLETVGLEQGGGLLSGLRAALGGRRGWGLPAIAVVIGLDAYTNFSGAAGLLATRSERADQLEPVRAELEARLRPVEATLGALPGQLEAEALARATAIVEAERAGTSWSGRSGAGPLFCAKAALLFDAPDCHARLAREPGPLWQHLRRTVAAQPVVGNGQGLAEELRAVATAERAHVAAVVAAIRARADALRPGDALESLQAEVDAMVSGPDDGANLAALTRALGGLDQAVQDRVAAHQAGLVAIADTARRVGGYDVLPSSVEALPLTAIEIDQSAIVVPPLEFHSGLGLARRVLEVFPGPAGPTILAAALALALLVSYLDAMLAFTWLRPTWRADREAALGTEAYLARLRHSMAEALSQALSSPPLAAWYGGVRWPVGPLAEALDDVVDARIAPPRPLEAVLTGQTPLALRAQARTHALEAALSPEGVREVIAAAASRLAGRWVGESRLLPGRDAEAAGWWAHVEALHDGVAEHALGEAAARLEALDPTADVATVHAQVLAAREATAAHGARRPEQARALEWRLTEVLGDRGRALDAEARAAADEEEREVTGRALASLRALTLPEPEACEAETHRAALEAAERGLAGVARDLDQLDLAWPRPEPGPARGAARQALRAARERVAHARAAARAHQAAQAEAARVERARADHARDLAVAAWWSSSLHQPPAARRAAALDLLRQAGWLESEEPADVLRAVLACDNHLRRRTAHGLPVQDLLDALARDVSA